MAGTATRAGGRLTVAGAVVLVVGSVVAAVPLLPSDVSPVGQIPQVNRIALLAAGGSLALLGLLLLALGLALYVLVPSFAEGGVYARHSYGSHRVILACTALALLIGNVLAALYFIPSALASVGGGEGLGRVAGEALSPTGIAVSAISPDLALLAVVYVRIIRPGAITWERMGLERRLLGRRVVIGILGSLFLFAASSLLELMLERLGVQQTQAEMFRSVRTSGLGGLALILLSGAVVAPIVEEIYFRGFVFRAYLEQKGPIPAFVFSAAIFAAIHLNGPALLPIFVMGLLLSFLYYRTGSIVPGIVAHGVNNTAAFLMLYFGLQ